jgi:hypothetical protein
VWLTGPIVVSMVVTLVSMVVRSAGLNTELMKLFVMFAIVLFGF